MDDDAPGGEPVSDDVSGDSTTGEPGADIADIEQVAAEFESQALADAGADADAAADDDTPGEGKTSGRAKPSASSDPVEDFINTQYGGNRAAFVASLHESRREGKELAAELRDLKRQLTSAPRDRASDLQALRSQDPDVQALDREIKSIDLTTRSIGQRQVQLAQEAAQIKTALDSKTGQLVRAEGDDKTSLHYEIIELKNDLKALNLEFLQNESEQRRNAVDRAARLRELRTAERDLEEQMEAEEQSTRTAQTSNARMRQQFEGAYHHIATETYGLDPKSPRSVLLQKAVRTHVSDYLHSLADQGETEPLDGQAMFGLVQRVVAQAAKEFNIKTKSASTNGRPVTPRPVGLPRPRALAPATPRREKAPSVAKDLQDDPNFWRNRAQHIAEHAGRVATRGRGGQGPLG
jgi:hypothetical protein